MPSPLTDASFPRALELSPKQVQTYERLAQIKIRDALQDYEQFVTTQARSVDTTRWRAIKEATADPLTLYKYHETANAITTATTSSSSKAKTSTTHSFLGAALQVFKANTRAPPPPRRTLGDSRRRPIGAFAVGHVPGELDEVMLGILARTDEEMAMQAAQADSDRIHGRVLAVLPAPITTTATATTSATAVTSETEVDPFRYHSIKWIARATSKMPYASSSTRMRDAVVLDCTGIRVLSNGQRVGYHIMESITLAECPPVAGFTRDSLSSCLICPQEEGLVANTNNENDDETSDDEEGVSTNTSNANANNANRTEVFMKAWWSTGDRATRTSDATVASATLQRLLQATRELAACGVNKKLTWMFDASSSLRARGRLTHRAAAVKPKRTAAMGDLGRRAAYGGGLELVTVTAPATCSQCRQRESRRHRLTSCALCLDVVCMQQCVTQRPMRTGESHTHDHLPGSSSSSSSTVSFSAATTATATVCNDCVRHTRQIPAARVIMTKQRQQQWQRRAVKAEAKAQAKAQANATARTHGLKKTKHGAVVEAADSPVTANSEDDCWSDASTVSEDTHSRRAVVQTEVVTMAPEAGTPGLCA